MGDTIAQTPMIENRNFNPLFESVCLSMGLNTNITEEIPVRLPNGFSVDMIREHLPNWLLNAVDEPAGKSRLAKYFQVTNAFT
jgi:protein-tyrosine phosphatase